MRKAAELKSRSPADRFELGSLYDELGDYQDAVTVFGRLCREFPGSFEANYNLALATFHLERFSEAQDILRRTIDENPRAEEYDLMTACNEESDDPVSAAKSYAKAIELDPTNEAYYLRSAQLALNRMAYDFGIFVESRYLLGRYYFDAGDLPTSGRELEKARALNPYHYATNLLLVRLYKKTGDPVKMAETKKLLEGARTNQAYSRYASRVRDASHESILFWESGQSQGEPIGRPTSQHQ